jgi:hypothetical protein
MPCRDDWGATLEIRDNPETKRRLDNVTRLLCGLCKELTRQGVAGYITKVPGLPVWWEEHQEADRRREQAERTAADLARMKKMKQLRQLAKELNVEIKT